MLEIGVEREIEKPRCFWAEWTLGSLTAIPSNREHLVKLPEEWKILTLRSDPSHQFLVSNSSVLLPALPVFGKDCLGGRSVGEKNHQPPSERERVCIVRANCGSGCERGMHDKHSSSPDILMDEPGMGIYTTEQPTTENTEESSERKKNRDVSFRHSGRRSDDSDRVFDVRGMEEYRNIRFDSSNSSDAEPDTTPKNKRSGKKSYLITITNRYIYFPLQSALLHRGNGGYISHDLTEGLLVAVLDQSTLPITEPSHNHDKFASHANPTIRDPSNETHILVSILGDQNRLNGGYLPISPRIPLGASLADGGGEERLPRIVLEGLIKTTCWKDEGNSEGYFRIVGHRIDTATNRRESIQSEIHTIRSIFHKSVDILLRLGRKPFYHPESQIRTFWMEDGSFRDAARGGAINQHPLDRRGTGEIKNWLNYHRSRGDNREKYVDLDSDVYEWSDHVKGSRVLPKDSAPKQNYSMMVYNRIGFPTDQDPTGWSRGSGMKYPKFSLIRERLEFLIRGSVNAGSPPSNPTNTMIVHPAETNGSVSGNYKPSQFFFPESIAPPSLSGTVTRSITDPFQIRNESDDARCTGGPLGNTTSAVSRGYDWFHPSKRVEKGSLKACSYGANTPKSLDYSHLGGGWPSSRNHNIEGNPRNHDLAYGQSRNILSLYILPTPAERPFLLPDRKIISVIQSQISKILSPNHSEGCDRPFAFAHNSYKLFDLSTQTDSPIHGKTSIDPTRNFSITTPLKGKRIGNLELGITYCWPHTRAEVITPVGKKCHDSPNDGKALSSSGFTRNQSRTDKGVGIRNKPDDTLYRIGESSRSSTEDSRNVIGNGVTDGESTSFNSFEDGTTYPTPSPHPNKLVGGTEMCMVPRGGRGNAFGIYDLFRAYTPRFLTHERRKYLNNAIPETIANILPKSNDHINMMNVRGVKIIDGQPPCKPIFEWLLRNDCNNDEYLIMGSPPSALPVPRKGSDYIDLWRRLGIIRYLIDPLRKYQSDRLMHRDMIRHSIGGRQNRFPSPNIKHSVKNRGYYSLTRDRINRWLDGNKGLDLYPPVRVPPIQFLVTDGNISRHELSIIYNHNFFNNNDSGYRTTQEQGLCHSRYLAGSYDKDMMNYPLQHSDSRNWVFPAPRQRITPLNYTSRIPPVPLQSGFPPSKGISPVGPVETGRSYPTNDLAADFDAPSIPISMSDSYKNERHIHIMVNDIKINGVKLLATSLRRLILILGLVERMSPRIIRIRDMHELNVKRERLTRPEIGTDFAPRSSLILSTGLASHAKRMIVIGPTHLPGETDPSLICSNRSDRSINIRMLSIPRRQKEFPVPLRSKRFNLEDKNLSCLNAFGYRIMCYYARDPAPLANEALLISICHSVPHDNAIGSVPLRQVVSGHDTYVDTSPNYPGRYVSRVGKATMHSIVVGIVPTSPSYGSEMKDPLSERRFDYSSEWYSESSIAETTVGEFTILSRASGCSAGSAARYSRFVPENQRDDSIHSVRSAEYDSTSARTAPENLVVGFPRLEIHKGKSIDGEIGFAPRSRTRAPPGTMREAAILAIPSLVLDREGYGMTDGTTARAPAQRLRLPVSNISDWMKAAPVRGKQTTCDHLQMNLDSVHAPCYPLCHAYKRISFQRLLRIIKEVGSQSGGMPLKDRFGILGVYIPMECGVEYQLPNKPVSSTGKRFVWDPGSLSRNCKFAFSHRESFIDEGGLMLKGLHAARGSKIGFGRGTKIKQFSAIHKDNFIPNAAIGESTAPGTYSEFAPGGQSIETLKRTDKIGVQSKHTHLFHPAYSYQARVTESPDTFAHFESPNNCERWLGVGSPPNALFTHSILPESYRYSLETFLANKVLLSQAIGVFSTDQ